MTPPLHLVPDLDDEAATPPIPADENHVDAQADTAVPVEMEAGPAPFSGTYTMVDGVVETPKPAGELPPIIAPWVRSPEGRRAAVVTTLRRWRYVALFHSLRLHVYWGRLARRSPHGLLRIACALLTWTQDQGVKASLMAMRAGVGGAGLEKLEAQHRANVRARAGVSAAVLVVALVAGFVWLALGLLWQTVTAAAFLPVFGYVGRNRERPIVERVIFQGVEVPKLTESLIVSALTNSRIPGVAQAYKQHGDKFIRWVKPPTRTKVGYEAILDLPAGVTVDDAAGKTGNIASGLSRPTSTVWLSGLSEENGGHEGRLHMVVTNAPMRSGAAPKWPLAAEDAGPFDIFQPIPTGVDYLGEPVSIRLMFRSGIIGALPRMGKTFTLRQLLLAAALDPTVELHVYDLKGGADLLGLGEGIPFGTGVCHAFRSGSAPEDAAAMLADLQAMRVDMERRYARIRAIVKEDLARCPEGKVTRELANDRSLGLHPVVLAIDETQVCFADWEQAKEFTAIVTDLVKRGPAAGIITLLATQNVDSATIPKSISRMASIRFALRVTDHVATDLILGTGAYSRGFRASELSIDDMGIGYLAGEGDLTKLVRCCFVDGPEANRIVARARHLRERAGRLTGLAAGEELEIDRPTDNIVEHLWTLWPQTAKGTPQRSEHSVTLAELLAEAYPALYDGWTAEQVTLAAKAAGLTPKTVKVRGSSTTGITWVELDAAQERRALAMAALDDPGDTDVEDQGDDVLDEVSFPWEDEAGEQVGVD